MKKKEKMNRPELGAGDALDILAILCCREDPVIHHGDDVDAGDLDYQYGDDTYAKNVRIDFWGGYGKFGHLIKGSSLKGMVLDRLGVRRDR